MHGQSPLGWSARICRRDFLAAFGSAVAALPFGSFDASAQPRVDLVVGLLEDERPSVELRQGFEMGASEVMRAAELIRAGFHTLIDGSVSNLLESGAHVIVGGVRSGAPAGLAISRSSRRGRLYLNAAAGANSLRSPACAPLGGHVVPSSAMAAQGRAWDPRLTRFGAEQLNDRYRHRFGSGMGEEAWCGWMAVKVAWEIVLRARSTDGAALVENLFRPATRFDGHKGRGLRFDARDRQLYQPLYAAEDAREVTVQSGPHPAHGRTRCES